MATPGPDRRIAFVEALLFVSTEQVEPAKIMEFLKIPDLGEFENFMQELEEHFHRENGGLQLKKSEKGLQLVTRPDFHEELKEFFTIRYSSKLSLASLETLAIIAYRQPVTLAEIADMRGVNSVTAAKNLLQKKLIRISGRKKVPGLPALYSTAPEFLTYFGLNDLSELPSLEELTELFEEKEQPSLF